MSRQWSRLAGDTDRFAIELAFATDPSPSEIAEERQSWGSFSLWAEGRNLCAHSEDGERLESVHWYLLPLLEWLAHGWDALLHEAPFPAETAAETGALALPVATEAPAKLSDDEADRWLVGWQGWWRRHAFQSARRGGLFPNVVLRRYRDQIELSWAPTRLPGMPEHVRFENDRGVARLSPLDVAEPLYEVLRAGTEALAGRLGHSDRIARLRQSVEAICDPRRKPDRLGWMVGLARQRWNHLREAAARIGPREAVEAVFEPREASAIVVNGSCHAALLFGSVSPEISDEDALALAARLVEAHSSARPSLGVDQVARPVALRSLRSTPWLEGYALAEEVLAALPPETSQGGIEKTLGDLGIEIQSVSLADPGIRGVAFAGDSHRPTILLNSSNRFNQGSAGRRFSLAHELCHLLFDQEAGRAVAVASGPWAPTGLEKRANAFAAMLLMPRVEVDRRIRQLDEPLASAQAVATLARRFDSGFTATLEHLSNLGFLDDEQRETIRAEYDDKVFAVAAH